MLNSMVAVAACNNVSSAQADFGERQIHVFSSKRAVETVESAYSGGHHTAVAFGTARQGAV
jgi:hypothetical protein